MHSKMSCQGNKIDNFMINTKHKELRERNLMQLNNVN